MSATKLEALTVRLPESEKKRIDQMASDGGVGAATLVRTLIQEALALRDKKQLGKLERTLITILLEAFYTTQLIADCHDANIKDVARIKAQETLAAFLKLGAL